MIQIEREKLEKVLEALENSVDLVSNEAREAEKMYVNVPTRLAKVQGLVALEVSHEEAITAIKEALAQHDSVQAKPEPEQETPKGWKSEIWKSVKQQEQEPVVKNMTLACPSHLHDYTTPPQRTWVGLTDEERKNIMIECESTGDWAWELKAAQAIEAKLKQKNGYAEEKNT